MWRACLFGFFAILLASCSSLRQEAPAPESQFGNREDDAADGRITTVIGPEDGTQVYRYGEAFVDEVHVRPAPFEGGPVAVEVLIKGAFPDSCTELHEATQARAGNIIDVTLTTRRPQGALCAAVVRPFRFYLLLEGQYGAGPYTAKINNGAHPFEIRATQNQGK